MASLGGITFFSLSGVPLPKMMEVELFGRDGYDGHGYQEKGLKGEPFTLRGLLDVVDDAALVSHLADGASLRGAIVSFLTDQAITATLLAVVEDVSNPRVKRVFAASGGTLAAGTPKYKVEWIFTLRYF